MSKPTNSELQILRILWKQGSQTVREINESMNLQRKATEKTIGYTTTLKLMQIMHEKRLLSRHREGKTHIYKAAITEQATQKQLLDRLLDTAFHGSAMNLVMQALGSRESSQEELNEIRRFLDQLSDDGNASNQSKN